MNTECINQELKVLIQRCVYCGFILCLKQNTISIRYFLAAMQINEDLKKFLQGVNGQGLGTRDKDLTPSYNRIIAAKASGNNTIKFTIAKQTAAQAIKNLRENKMVSLVQANILNFECYQFKGSYISHHDSTSEEKADVENYFNKMNEALIKIGVQDGLVYNFPHDPTITIEFEVEQIFEQTPKIGTGNLIKA